MITFCQKENACIFTDVLITNFIQWDTTPITANKPLKKEGKEMEIYK